MEQKENKTAKYIADKYSEKTLKFGDFQINEYQMYSADSIAHLFDEQPKKFTEYCTTLFPNMQPLYGPRGRKKKWMGRTVIEQMLRQAEMSSSNEKKTK